jgi:hypothetical protein
MNNADFPSFQQLHPLKFQFPSVNLSYIYLLTTLLVMMLAHERFRALRCKVRCEQRLHESDAFVVST